MNNLEEAIEAIHSAICEESLEDHMDPAWPGRCVKAAKAAAPIIAAQALQEVADRWQQGEWANAPRRADRIQERIANGQHVGDWLRAQAENQENR